MKKYDLKWHQDDIRDELAELSEETNFIKRWSEYSDVAYTYTRARWTGYKLPRPISRLHICWGLVYMFPKYSFRWLFFKRVGKHFGVRIHEVRNPKKVEKLDLLAKRYDIPPDQFVKVCRQKLRYWPLLP